MKLGSAKFPMLLVSSETKPADGRSLYQTRNLMFTRSGEYKTLIMEAEGLQPRFPFM